MREELSEPEGVSSSAGQRRRVLRLQLALAALAAHAKTQAIIDIFQSVI